MKIDKVVFVGLILNVLILGFILGVLFCEVIQCI